MNAVYLSGTGNTRHIVNRLLDELGNKGTVLPIESEDVKTVFASDEIIIAYPTQFSNIPYLVRDFINNNQNEWKDKKIFLITTMGMFAGDGTGCAARLLKKYGAVISGGIQIKMPDSVCDFKGIAAQMKAGKYPQEGLSFWSHLAGFFGQRLWFYNKTTGYSKKLKIDSDKCIGCGICENGCPTHNIKIENGKAVADVKCTMCYRCISYCPKQAITLLGKEVVQQAGIEKYT